MRAIQDTSFRPFCHRIATQMRSCVTRLGDSKDLVTGVWQTGGPHRTSPCMKKSKAPLPTCNLDDPLWTTAHIATYLGMRLSAAYKRTAETDFPTPVGEARRHRRWLAGDVVEFFATSANSVSPNDRVSSPPRAAAASTLRVHRGELMNPSITFRSRRGEAA
jgi:predicted DNA-binding transcriptional regulator AlpA